MATPAAPTAPAAPKSGTPSWLVALAAALLGTVGMLAYERWASGSSVPPLPAPAPTPTPVKTTPVEERIDGAESRPLPASGVAPGAVATRPGWLPALESSLDRLNTQLQGVSDWAKSRPEPDLTPLTSRIDRVLVGLEAARAAQPATPAPAVYYYQQPQCQVIGGWSR